MQHITWNPIDVFSSNMFSQYGEDGILNYMLSNNELFKSKYTYIYLTDFKYKLHNKIKTNPILCLLKTKHMKQALDIHKSLPLLYQLNLHTTKQLVQTCIRTDTIDILILDTYGNDFWILKSFIQECKEQHKPNIIVVHYNNAYPSDMSITIPYTRNKSYAKDSYYWGASLLAYCNLLKDYHFIGCSLYGVLGFFVKKSVVTNSKDPYLQCANIQHCFLYPNVQYKIKTQWPHLQKRLFIQVK